MLAGFHKKNTDQRSKSVHYRPPALNANFLMLVKGWVYVITNKAMPGLVKVGFSLKDPVLRAKELENAGMPYPFHVEHKILIHAARDTEQEIHRQMRQWHEAKEWFRCPVEQAIADITVVAGTRIFFEENSQSKSPRSAEEEIAQNRNLELKRQREREERAQQLEEAEKIRAKFALRRQGTR
jgi:hypothetical protein